MVRSVTVFDEDFTEDDLASALDWQAGQANICNGCGGWLDETTHPDNDGKYDGQLIACHKCAVGDRVERAYRDKGGEMAGIRRSVWEIDD